tara:strand:+ start:284 stop:487 length:204 start_codon:yes stop_codon:yes gene_type:complete
MIIEYCGIKMGITYNYEESEPQSYDYPGSPESATIENVEINGIDIYEMLTIEQLYDIEGIIMQNLQK